MGEADRGADNNVLDWSQFPLSTMIRRGWIPASRDDAAARPQALIEHFLAPVGDPRSVLALYRQSTVVRSARPLDRYALIAWTVRVLTRAIEATSRLSQKAATVNSEFMREVAKLSWFDEGPRLAKELRIHPGIVAGRIRYARKNFRMLNQFVGHGRVRKLFPEVTWDVA